MSARIPQMSSADVEQISLRLAAVRRNHLEFVPGERPPEPAVEIVKEKKKRPKTRSETGELTRSQRMAQTKFYDIDTGKLDAQSVFGRVTATAERVDTKLSFFRDRLELVLPAIEERFIVRDEKRDCEVLDLPRLHRGKQSARTPRKKAQMPRGGSTCHSQHPDSDPHESHSDEQGDEEPRRTLQHVMSVESVLTRPSEHSIETGEQRSLRILQAGRVRDERIHAAQQSVKNKEMEWRLRHLQCTQAKSLRKEKQQLAAAQRTIFVWMITAMVTQTLKSQLSKAQPQRQEGSDSKGQQLATKSKAHWIRAKRIVNTSVIEKGNLQEVFQERALRSKTAWQRWDNLLRATKFLARLKYRSKLTRSAVAMRQFLEGAWRGMRFRARVAAYLSNVRALQRAMRAAIKFRVQLRSFVYLPTLWEVETQLLGEKLMAHLPKGYTKQRIETHRQTWDLEGRIRLLQDAAKERRIAGLGRKGYMTEKRNPRSSKNAVPRGGRADLRRRRNAAVRATDRPERLVVFSELGEAIPTSATERKQQQALMIANNVLDHYRLDLETRRNIVYQVFIQALARWKEHHRAYLSECKRLNKVWQHWRLEIQALGPQRKEHWPKPPPFPQPPSEMYTVDTKKLRSMLIAALAQSQLGRSLFARDIRRASNG